MKNDSKRRQSVRLYHQLNIQQLLPNYYNNSFYYCRLNSRKKDSKGLNGMYTKK